MRRVAAHERGRPTAAAPRFGRQRRRSRRPQAHRRLDADDVGQAHLRQSGAEGRIDAVAGVGQHHAARHAGGQRRLDLVKRDLRLGAEDDILRDACFGPPVRIVCPALRQIEPVGDGQARMVIGHRQAHRDLAVVLLAELAAILAGHADRMLALLGKAGVVDDPGADRSLLLERRQHLAPAPPQAPPRPTTPPSPRSDAATDAPPGPARAQPAPPSAPRSCARPAAAAPCNRPSTAPSGQRDRAPTTRPRHRPQTAIHSSSLQAS